MSMSLLYTSILPLYIRYPENRTVIIYTIKEIKLMAYDDIRIKNVDLNELLC